MGQQQRVEILKALYRNADILILDEPTAVLTPQEASELFEIVRSLTAQGKSIVFISHKLNEVTRDRRPDHRAPAREADRDAPCRRARPRQGLARLMVGREVLLRVEKGPSHARRAAPRRRATSPSFDDRGIKKVPGLSLQVRAGEIVGIAGIDGNGQTELIDAMSGLRKIASGTVSLKGDDVTDHDARGHFKAGLGHIPEDRQRRGLVLEFSIAENLALHDYRDEPDSRFGWLFRSG